MKKIILIAVFMLIGCEGYESPVQKQEEFQPQSSFTIWLNAGEEPWALPTDAWHIRHDGLIEFIHARRGTTHFVPQYSVVQIEQHRK